VLLLDEAGWQMTSQLVVPDNLGIMSLPAKCLELSPQFTRLRCDGWQRPVWVAPNWRVSSGSRAPACVTQTAREFGDRDFNAIVVEDACAGMDDTRHRAALDTIALTSGIAASIDDVLSRL